MAGKSQSKNVPPMPMTPKQMPKQVPQQMKTAMKKGMPNGMPMHGGK